jgi:hypothetical protein
VTRARGRERDETNRRAAAKAGEPLYTSPPGWTGLQALAASFTLWLRGGSAGEKLSCHGTA